MISASIASFINVVTYRLPNKISFRTGGSVCPFCDTRLIGALCISVPMLLLTLLIEGSFGRAPQGNPTLPSDLFWQLELA
ncbi:prepilin peptidase [Parasporobacterium paucivorans]|uniref:prepilin peptidase n=1 Tax=Parasporobacterium paucivorans TaxID=115544 RepID=UPI00093B0CC1|nr:prepilin peptidase [Parasporobacterium paucivorans]